MTLTENELNKIKAIFERIDYGRVTFSLSPKKTTLDYTVETTHKIPLTGCIVKQRRNGA